MYKKIVILTVLILLTVSLAVMAQNSIDNYANNYQNKVFNITSDQSLSAEQKAQKVEQAGTEFMQKMLSDPNIPEEIKAQIRQSLEDMKQYKVDQAKKEAEEQARIKAENEKKKAEEEAAAAEDAQYFTITVPGKNSLNGRYINGKPYFVFPAGTLDVENAVAIRSGGNLYTYNNSDELSTARHACGASATLVELEELINLCNNDKKSLDIKKFDNSPKEFLTVDPQGIYVFMCAPNFNDSKFEKLTQMAARNAGFTTYGNKASAKKLCNRGAGECEQGTMSHIDGSLPRAYYNGTVIESKKLRYSVLCELGERKYEAVSKDGKKHTFILK